MIEGPYSSSSLNLSCDGRFAHLASSYLPAPSTSSSCSSPTSSSQPSPSSTSPSSFDDSPCVASKFLSIADRLSSAVSSTNFSTYPSPCTEISAASSTTSTDLASPCNQFCHDFTQDDYSLDSRPAWPVTTTLGTEVALKHSSNLQRQACSLQPLPKEQLQNPRRTRRLLEQQDERTPGLCNEARACPLPPPSLVRQTDRKVNFVDNLVDTAAQIVEAIWPSSIVYKPCEPSLGRVLPLRTFIQETLRRSRTSYSTLQVALYYLFVIRPFIPIEDPAPQPEAFHDVRALQCGRRMFLAALILASKYLQDRNYSARAWSKISGLNISEINSNELAFLATVNWRLHISDQIFDKWTKIVLKCTPTTSILPAKGAAHSGFVANKWVRILSRLDMSLDSSVLDEVLGDELSISDVKVSRPSTADADRAKASVSSLNTANSHLKMTSMAFALATPSGARGLCNESMPQRPSPLGCGDSAGNRGSRKSSLSVCETVGSSEMDISTTDSPVSTCSSTTTLLPPRHFRNANSTQTPLREKILGQSNTRPDARRLASAPSAMAVHEASTGRNRKRGNETPVASRHQKKQKDKLGEFTAPKPSDVVPSGLTPQMRQMNTSFSMSGKKGNGLRMNINPGFAASGAHGQALRPGTGQRSMSHVVYG
ncbi:hypothetical protein TWF696_006583 [Orbilia brochopaga]|uniref:G1/S-specific cyclin pas1 n=1 Tax=Orbilia brochopaga TaxID=3140254 RepID=A0AAV9UZH0_9PEZI